MKVGLDVGSTTIKCVVLDDQNNIVYKSYERHLSQITEKMSELLTKVRDEVIHGTDAQITVSGSAGMGVAETCNLPFMQEVYATRIAIGKLIPDFVRRHGSPYERYVRWWNGGLHRPDGDPAECIAR